MQEIDCNTLKLFYSKNKAPNGPNYTHFENKIYDDLYDQSFLETNESKRFEIYKKMSIFLGSFSHSTSVSLGSHFVTSNLKYLYL